MARLLTLLLLVVMIPSLAVAERPAEVMRVEMARAENAASLLLRGRYTEFRVYLSESSAVTYSAQSLENYVSSLKTSLGEVRYLQAAYPIPASGNGVTRAAAVPIDFERGEIDLLLGWRGDFAPGALVTIQSRRRMPRPSITSAPVRPTEASARPDPPYVYTHLFREERVAIQRGNLSPAEGWLSIPEQGTGGRRVPAILILGEMHAAGADSIAGNLATRRDLARGLASRGIAVLRLETRDPRDSNWTLESHLLADAREGLRLMSRHPSVDPRRLYIAGHEVGGIHAALLARQVTALRGAIILGAPPRWSAPREMRRAEIWSSQRGQPTAHAVNVLRLDLTAIQEGRLAPNGGWAGWPWAFWEEMERRDAIALLTGYSGRLLYLAPERSHLLESLELGRWRGLIESLPAGQMERVQTGHWLTSVREDRDSALTPGGSGFVALEVVEVIESWINLVRD